MLGRDFRSDARLPGSIPDPSLGPRPRPPASLPGVLRHRDRRPPPQGATIS